MNGPIRQLLADVASVTPTLNDKALTIQANTVKTSSYTAIYNLFKAGFDAVYAPISALTGYATELYADTVAATAEANAIAVAKAYTDGEVATRQLEYSLGNTGSGTTSATINAISGVATFTQILPKKSSAYYEINNTEIQAGDFIECNLRYDGAGYPLIMHYRTIADRIRIHVANVAVDGGSGTDTNANLIITFRKI